MPWSQLSWGDLISVYAARYAPVLGKATCQRRAQEAKQCCCCWLPPSSLNTAITGLDIKHANRAATFNWGVEDNHLVPCFVLVLIALVLCLSCSGDAQAARAGRGCTMSVHIRWLEMPLVPRCWADRGFIKWDLKKALLRGFCKISNKWI